MVKLRKMMTRLSVLVKHQYNIYIQGRHHIKQYKDSTLQTGFQVMISLSSEVRSLYKSADIKKK